MLYIYTHTHAHTHGHIHMHAHTHTHTDPPTHHGKWFHMTVNAQKYYQLIALMNPVFLSF